MHPIIYDVAVSADGFIAGPGGDVSKFPHDGPIVHDYASRSGRYAHVLMGRATYEFGYAYGLSPGENPYPHAESIVISKTIALPDDGDVTHWTSINDGCLDELRARASGPIYLCGDGRLAASLLAMGQIDELRLKRAPVLLGGGTPLFTSATPDATLRLRDQTDYGGGLLNQAFAVGSGEDRDTG
ncbi:MAG: dihydrofolate reductase family protein [Pseudomonadota bacterium]